MRSHQPPEVGELDAVALPAEQMRPKLRLQLLNRPRERRLCDMALRSGPVEVQGLASGKKVSDLMHLHGLFS